MRLCAQRWLLGLGGIVIIVEHIQLQAARNKTRYLPLAVAYRFRGRYYEQQNQQQKYYGSVRHQRLSAAAGIHL